MVESDVGVTSMASRVPVYMPYRILLEMALRATP